MNLSQTLKVRSNVICREKIVKPSNGGGGGKQHTPPQVAKQYFRLKDLKMVPFGETKPKQIQQLKGVL